MDLGGIDLDTTAGLERVRRWLAGGADDDLDHLDSGALLAEWPRSLRGPDWALDEVLANHEHLVQRAWAAGACRSSRRSSSWRRASAVGR